MITEYKKERLKHDIAQLPDHIVGRAEYLKDYFDQNVYEVINESLNPLIDELNGQGGASNIGAAAFSAIPAGTVQSQLQGLKALMDNAVWGIPDSCDTDALKAKAVTRDKLSDEVTARLDEAFYPVLCTAVDGGFAISGEIPADCCTVRFVAPAAFVKGNVLTVNGVSYLLTMVNGKALGDDAWVAGAVVGLQLDPESQKAFFSGGGADLSFVTAGAAQIMSGFIGADADGEPVIGTRTVQVYSAPASSIWLDTSTSPPYVKATFPMPDFAPDAVIVFLNYTYAYTYNGATYTAAHMPIHVIDYVNQRAVQTFVHSNNWVYNYVYGNFNWVTSSYSKFAGWSECPYYDKQNAASILLDNSTWGTTGTGLREGDSGTHYLTAYTSMLYAIKF